MAKKKSAKEVVETVEQAPVKAAEVVVETVEVPVVVEEVKPVEEVKVVEEAPVAFHDSEVPALVELEEAKKEVEEELNNAPVAQVELPTTDVWEEKTHEQFEKWSKSGNYEIRFKGALIYDSLNPCGVVAFYPAFVKIGHRRFQYNLIQLVRK